MHVAMVIGWTISLLISIGTFPQIAIMYGFARFVGDNSKPLKILFWASVTFLISLLTFNPLTWS